MNNVFIEFIVTTNLPKCSLSSRVSGRVLLRVSGRESVVKPADKATTP